jgi:hypothetical protein
MSEMENEHFNGLPGRVQEKTVKKKEWVQKEWMQPGHRKWNPSQQRGSRGERRSVVEHW